MLPFAASHATIAGCRLSALALNQQPFARSAVLAGCFLQRLAQGSLLHQRGLCEQAHESSDGQFTVTVNPYKAHRVEPPSLEVKTSKDELLHLFQQMYKARRMELAADMLYKQKKARGFLHLADGQEATTFGMEAAITKKDSIIQSYRNHVTFLGRGGTVKEVAAELMGRIGGAAQGKGGSMHLYKKENHYYGGEGIVGDQVPLGTGIALAHKFRKEPNVCFTIYGDGAANQGQVFESYNIAAIWSLPVVYVCENNHYGMGTADRRAAASYSYYSRGDYIPGLWVDGMDVLAVKNACAFAKKHALENGPIILEMDTYRYHGHSVSDPGSTYRTRDEISGIRRARDPIEHVKTLLEEHGGMDASELKKLEKQWKAEVQQEIEEAAKSPPPPDDLLWKHTYVDGLGAMFRPIEISLSKIPV